MKKVAVLMSTYNGESYLREQVESILLQKNVNVEIVIRDDGSSDTTVEILNEFSRNYPNIHTIFGKNLGYANSFLTLLKYDIEADYYAFADQDDVWFAEKIIRAITILESNKASIYASPLRVVDEELNYIGVKYFPGYIGSIGSTLSRNRLAGCTMVFSRNLRDIMKKNCDGIIIQNTFNYGHDGWLLLFCFLFGGKVYLDSEPFINYRRHGYSVTCINSGITNRITSEWKNYPELINIRKQIIPFLLSRNGIDKDTREYLILLSKYRSNLVLRFKLLLSSDMNTGIKAFDFINKIAVITGRY